MGVVSHRRSSGGEEHVGVESGEWRVESGFELFWVLYLVLFMGFWGDFFLK